MALAYLAEVVLKPDCFDSACRAVGAIVQATRAETGCERFDPHPAADGSPRIFIYERWADQAAFDFHHAQPYTRDVFRAYEDWLAQPVRLTELANGLN
ncbi:antibiotic biosynthesis monooxygenase [Sandaracinobacter sp. RS1-74]|uniref:putative quinol monooxygenase n=1 Tax=Sandaracinobacteroides sayramensis TaxID=2913411 RepID=UPI001EDB3639|nr:putative quinol monooxygenase [Sandaracinobacteroides sayramensis]MCG2841166.1 antibiotic biosynthesis monooxygenase [Sandaracinobacteroides sayramensis]